MATITCRDFGFAFRKYLEGKPLTRMYESKDEITELTGLEIDIDYIDISDVCNPIVHLANGQAFQIRIFLKG